MHGKVLNGRNKEKGLDGVKSSSISEPHDDMEFESKEEAFSFYKEYAKFMGFSTIIKASRRSRISGNFIDAKFVCTRYGSKHKSSAAESSEPAPISATTTIVPVKKKRGRINKSLAKTDCKACMHVKRRQDGRWIIASFIKDHNHELVQDQAYKCFRDHRNRNTGNVNADALSSIQASIRRQSSGHKKAKNEKGGVINQIGCNGKLALEEGDVQVMLESFIDMQDENPLFFYAIDLSEEQCLRNVLWIDAKGRLDYENFSDIVFLDTGCMKNKYKLPFIPFIGVNHHNQFILLGCALILEESKATYTWLMKTWLKAMGGRAPTAILSDQDGHLKEAIAEVFPESHHCFCLWHILSKISEKLSYVTRQLESFLKKFDKCIFKSSTAVQFEKRWLKMVDKYDVKNDRWIESLYRDRQRWVPAYTRYIFMAGMSTAQRSENMNFFLDKYLQRKTSMKDFLAQYKVIMKEKCEEEAKADIETWHSQLVLKSPSPFGKHMATIYTHSIFKKFQVEVLGVVACHPKKVSEDGSVQKYMVQDFEHNQEFSVIWNEKSSDASCSCGSFENNGYLCRHVMIVLQISGLHNIPAKYILKRWTKDAKSRPIIQGSDLIGSRVHRYKDLCRRAFKLGDEGSISQESFSSALDALEKVLRKCERVNNSSQSAVEPSSWLPHDCHEFNEPDQGNRTSKSTKKSISNKTPVYLEQDLMTMGIHNSWQQMEQLRSGVQTPDGSFGSQQIGHIMYNLISPGPDDNHESQQCMHMLGQFKSLAPIHDGQYNTQQSNQGLDQPNLGRNHFLGHDH